MHARIRRSAMVAAIVAVGCCGVGASAQADGPGVGTPAIVALGDSAISGEAGRWAGNTNNSSSRVDALGSTAYHDVAGAEAIRGCHRSKAAEVHIGDGVLEREPRVLGRAHVDERGRQRLQARHRLLLGRLRPQGPGARPSAVRGDAQRARGHAADRRQQLRVRRHRAAVRDRLADLPVVVAELLLRRLQHQVPVHAPRAWRRRPRTSAARSSTSARRWPRPATRTRQYTILAQTYSSPIPRGSGFRYPQSGFTRQTIGGCGVWNRDADWANDTVVQHVQQHDPQRRGAAGLSEREGRRHDERAGRSAAVREQRRPARGARRRQLADRGGRRQDRVGQPDPHRHRDLPPVPDPGGRPSELLGPAGAAQLPAAGVQRRRRRAAGRARSAGSG